MNTLHIKLSCDIESAMNMILFERVLRKKLTNDNLIQINSPASRDNVRAINRHVEFNEFYRDSAFSK